MEKIIGRFRLVDVSAETNLVKYRVEDYPELEFPFPVGYIIEDGRGFTPVDGYYEAIRGSYRRLEEAVNLLADYINAD